MKAVEVVGALILGLAIGAGLLALQAAVIMLILSGLHDHVSASVPAVGFGGSVLIAVALDIVGSFFRRAA